MCQLGGDGGAGARAAGGRCDGDDDDWCDDDYDDVGHKLWMFTEHKGFVQGVAIDPLGQYLATLSDDRFSADCCSNVDVGHATFVE